MGTLLSLLLPMLLLAGFAYALWKPGWAILFIVILYPLEQVMGLSVPFLASRPWFLNVFVGAVCVLALVSSLVRDPNTIKAYFNPVVILSLALYSWATLGIFFSPDTTIGMGTLRGSAPYLILFLLIAPGLVGSPQDIHKLSLPLILIGSGIVLAVMLHPSAEMRGGRLVLPAAGFAGEYANPLATAQLGGMIMITAALVQPVKATKLIQLIRLGGIAAGFAMMLLANSRGQLIAAVIIPVLLWPFARSIRNVGQFFLQAAMIGLVGLVGFVVVTMFASEDITERWAGDMLSEGAASRQQYASAMLTEIANQPAALLTGLGTGSFAVYGGTEDPYMHNLPLQVLFENGLIGTLILVAVYLFLFFPTVRMIKACRDRPEVRSSMAILLAWVGYETLLSFKQGDYYGNGSPFWLVMMLGAVLARNQHLLKPADEQADYAFDDDTPIAESDDDQPRAWCNKADHQDFGAYS